MCKGITVIIPTIGRESLYQTLDSVEPQLNPEDALVVISETHDPKLEWVLSSGPGVHYLVREGGNYGHTNRNYVLDHHVHTSHVWTLDDDDIATPGALEAMRAHMDDAWTIFKMHFGSGHAASGLTLPHWPRVAHGNIGTPMLFAPLSRARFGEHYSGDHDYAAELQTLLGLPIWAEETVAIVRPIMVAS